MPAIKSKPPAKGTYRFVLRRYDIAPVRAQTFMAYDETAKSRAVELDGKVAQTLFVRSVHTKDRAVRLGWKDVTRIWFNRLNGPALSVNTGPAVEPTPPPIAQPPVQREKLSRDAGLIYNVLLEAPGPMQRKGIVETAGVSPSNWSKSINELMEAGYVVRQGTGRDTAYGLS